MQGYIFLNLPPRLGKKYDDLLGKKANMMGNGVEKLKKGEIFTVLGGKNMFLEKGGWAKIYKYK